MTLTSDVLSVGDNPPRRPRGAWRLVVPAILLVFFVFLAVALVAPAVLSPFDPYATDPLAGLRPPDAAHWMGTDQLGRDLTSRIVYGARFSVVTAIAAVLLALAVATVLGIGAAFARGWWGEVLARVLDLLSALPSILVALLFVTIFGRGIPALTLAIALATLPGLARVIRRSAMAVRASEYYRAALTFGERPLVVVARHVLPNALAPVLLLSAIEIGTAILTVAGLSFVGLGPERPVPEWGAMLAEGRDVLAHAWWPTFFPGVAIFVTIVAFTVTGRLLQRRFTRTEMT